MITTARQIKIAYNDIKSKHFIQSQLPVDKILLLVGSIATAVFAILISSKKRKEYLCMNISDRIQNLRKMKGISQEQLADVLGVSRQAVSKWESEQSTPDIEKIITMSDYFEVTTDYILKGIEPVTEHNKQKVHFNAVIFSIAASAINILGMIVGVLTWYDSQDMIAYAGMYILIILGIMLWGIGLVICNSKTRKNSIKVFAALNIWILSFTPLSLIYNICTGSKLLAPYPIHVGAIRYYLLFWVVYIIVGILGEIIIFRKKL